MSLQTQLSDFAGIGTAEFDPGLQKKADEIAVERTAVFGAMFAVMARREPDRGVLFPLPGMLRWQMRVCAFCDVEYIN